jgi:hypothetical protein
MRVGREKTADRKISAMMVTGPRDNGVRTPDQYPLDPIHGLAMVAGEELDDEVSPNAR